MLGIEFGSLAGWITALSATGVFGVVLTFLLKWRGMSLGEDESIRGHYAKEVQRLTDKIESMDKLWRKQLDDVEARANKRIEESELRHEECLADRDALKKRITELEDDITGLVRLIAQNSAEKVLHLGDDISPHIRSAAERVAAQGVPTPRIK